MTPVIVLVTVIAYVGVRLARRSGRFGRSGRQSAAPAFAFGLPGLLGDTGLVAEREIRDRLRGRIFRLGTLLVLVAVVLGIVIPTLHKGGRKTELIGVVGAFPTHLRAIVAGTGKRLGTTVRFVAERSAAAADADLRSGRIGLAIDDGRKVTLHRALSSSDASTNAQLARAIATSLGVEAAIRAAGISPAQAARLGRAKPLPITGLQPATDETTRTTSLIGLPLLLFLFLTYNSWILLGVMEEKSSRVVEVLLATIRPLQLLAGKVLGIGIVALTQATLIVAAALIAAKASGSDIAKGTTPLVLAAILVWLLLGYAFYCWVYAAIGSMAERRDQVQSLLVPLNVPLVFAYVVALTAQSSGNPSTLVKILAYLPPTAPFAMPALVSMHAVSWWQFTVSAAISILTTLAIARLAAGIYRRAILRMGQRVRLRDVLRQGG